MDSQSNEAIDQALHIAHTIVGNGGGVNLIAPNTQLHVNVQNTLSDGVKITSEQTLSKISEYNEVIPIIYLDLYKLSKPALTEISYQLCLICCKRYCEEC